MEGIWGPFGKGLLGLDASADTESAAENCERAVSAKRKEVDDAGIEVDRAQANILAVPVVPTEVAPLVKATLHEGLRELDACNAETGRAHATEVQERAMYGLPPRGSESSPAVAVLMLLGGMLIDTFGQGTFLVSSGAFATDAGAYLASFLISSASTLLCGTVGAVAGVNLNFGKGSRNPNHPEYRWVRFKAQVLSVVAFIVAGTLSLFVGIIRSEASVTFEPALSTLIGVLTNVESYAAIVLNGTIAWISFIKGKKIGTCLTTGRTVDINKEEEKEKFLDVKDRIKEPVDDAEKALDKKIEKYEGSVTAYNNAVTEWHKSYDELENVVRLANQAVKTKTVEIDEANALGRGRGRPPNATKPVIKSFDNYLQGLTPPAYITLKDFTPHYQFLKNLHAETLDALTDYVKTHHAL